MDPRTRSGLSALVGVALLAVLVAGCGEEPEPTPPGVEDLPTQRTYDYSTRHSRDALPVWELFGNVAEQYQGEDTMYLTGVRMVFYRDGETDAVLTSQRGEVDQETEATVARGNVVVVTEDGRRLESEVLYWDPERELIHTEAFVRFTEGDQVLTGYGLETDPDLTNVQIQRDVKGVARDETGTSDPEGR